MSKKNKEEKVARRKAFKEEVLAKMASNRLKIREYNKLRKYDKANQLSAENRKLGDLL